MAYKTQTSFAHSILIHSAHHETRVAVLADGVVQELHIERHSQRGVVGNLYLGKVIRVLPGMQSAFIDIGESKAAFLHIADVWQIKQRKLNDKNDTNDKLRLKNNAAISSFGLNTNILIEKLIFVGQTLLVQVIKDPIGTKGARLTTQISLAGRYMVLLPQDKHIGVSQKMPDTVKQAVYKRLEAVLPNGFMWGLIVRTQAQDASVSQLASDITYLTHLWQQVSQYAQTQPAPALLHRDVNLAQRVLRDICTEYTQSIQIDGTGCYKQLTDFAGEYMPAILPKLALHTAEHGLFDLAQVDVQVNAALNRRVALKSGAYLVIDQTESMCTIDVNTGSFVGNKQFAETVLATNLEAAQAIAHQLRLRNLGGIILVDFIDMVSNSHRAQVSAELEKCLANDPVRSQIYGFTALGLMELSRKRVRESLAHVLLQACACCEQTAQIKTPQTVAYEILREIELQARQFTCKGFVVRTALAVVDWFEKTPAYLDDLSKLIQRPITLLALEPAMIIASGCAQNPALFELLVQD